MLNFETMSFTCYVHIGFYGIVFGVLVKNYVYFHKKFMRCLSLNFKL